MNERRSNSILEASRKCRGIDSRHNTRGREIAKSAAENKGFPRKVVVASKNTYRDEYTPSDYVYDLARSHYYCLSSSLSEIVAVLLSLCDDRANTY